MKPRLLHCSAICLLVVALTAVSFVNAATPPDQGPGGPILVVSSTANPFTKYYAEILRAEGLNSFAVVDISSVSASTLASYDVVLLGEMPLTTTQVTMFSDYVTSGGNLIAMRPDKQLAGLLGLTATASTLSDRYLLVDTSSGPGVGIVNQTMQFHGTADLYTLSGASSLATLYSNSATATTNPAVTWQNVGPNGGQAAAFTFDLARSVVYTRQGNPAWSGQERDGITPIRSDDLYFGAAASNPQPDWVDLSKVQIPQADEQQRLLANLILLMNVDRKPLPRFWYFPNGKKAVVIMTSDSHQSDGIQGRFNTYMANSPSGCSVANWECIRASAYISSGTVLTNSQAASYIANGFDIGWHINTGCLDWTSQSQLDTSYYTPQLSAFATNFPSVPAPTTNRTHCVVWSDYSSQPQVELNHGIRLDTTYYYYPGTWVNDQPGLFTGSGMPMRFATSNGTLIDVYQATTQMTDESGQSYPLTINTLLDNAIGPAGYYGAFTANMHSDVSGGSSCCSGAIVASAQARSVSIVSAKQMLTWLDGRNSSSFNSLAWNGSILSFSIGVGTGANGLQAMLPTTSSAGPISSITVNGSPVTFTKQTIKGIEYAIFPAAAGAYQVSYNVDTTPPVTTITANPPPLTNSTSASFSFTSSKPLSSFSCSLDGGSFTACESPWNLSNLAVTSHTFQVRATDAGGRTGAPAAFVWTINTSQIAVFTDTTVGDFSAGAAGASTYISQTTDGEVILAPTAGAEFVGSGIPAGWFSTPWLSGGIASVANGLVTVDGALVGTNTFYGPGHSLDFIATFSGAPYQHVGFGVSFGTAPWAMFSTGSGGGSLYARTNNGTTVTDTPIRGSWLGSPHRYRIDWNGSNVVFWIDGNIVATNTVSISTNMRPLASDYNVGGGAVSVDWMRMSPYAASGLFLSRVFDATTTVNWGAASWTSNTPAGTTVAISVRGGNTPVPDSTWTGFTPIANTATAITGTSRYLQYQAVLTSTAAGQTPALNDITFAGLKSAPPSIASLSPTSGSVGTSVTISGSNFGSTQGASTVSFNGTTATSISSWSATSVVAVVPTGATTGNVVVTVGGLASNAVAFTVTTSLVITALSPTSGPVGSSVTISGSNFGATQGPSTVTFNGTAAAPTSWSATSIVVPVPTGATSGNVVVTVGGVASNGSPFTVTTSAPTNSLADTTAADFSGGTLDPNSYVSQTADGEVTLAPTAGTEFFGTALPAGWFSTPWAAGGSGSITNGVISVDGDLIGNNTLYGAGRSLEFVATFSGAAYQHVGFGVNFGNAPWAIFSTGSAGGSLYARTNNGSTATDTPIAGSWLGSAHRFRIDWNASSIVFSIDGNVVATHTVSFTNSMRPLASDYNVGGGAVSIDWMRMSPYAASGTFLSRVFDAAAVVNWGTASWTSSTPAGTSLGLSVRLGNTPVPDGTWTAFTPIASSGGAISGTSRYLQYQATLSTTVAGQTPALNDITFTASGGSDTSGSSINVIFSGTALPAGWFSTPWAAGGSASVANGAVTVDGDLIGTNTFYGAGHSLQFTATFSGAAYEHSGYGVNLGGAPWAIFSTGSGGGNLYTRTNNGTTVTDTSIPGSWLGAPHLYRIDWNTSNVVYSIDGNIVATHPVVLATNMRPLISDFFVGGGAVIVSSVQQSP